MKHWVRRPFTYLGQALDRGQIFELRGGPQDERLERLGYCVKLPKNSSAMECGQCGAKFIDEGLRNAHVKSRHIERNSFDLASVETHEVVKQFKYDGQVIPRGAFIHETELSNFEDLYARGFLRALTEDERKSILEESGVDEAESRLNQVAPVYLDKTAASRGVTA